MIRDSNDNSEMARISPSVDNIKLDSGASLLQMPYDDYSAVMEQVNKIAMCYDIRGYMFCDCFDETEILNFPIFEYQISEKFRYQIKTVNYMKFVSSSIFNFKV